MFASFHSLSFQPKKLNSSDFMKGGLSEEDALLNVRWLAESGVCDFCEISGGNYENPCEFMRASRCWFALHHHIDSPLYFSPLFSFHRYRILCWRSWSSKREVLWKEDYCFFRCCFWAQSFYQTINSKTGGFLHLLRFQMSVYYAWIVKNEAFASGRIEITFWNGFCY